MQSGVKFTPAYLPTPCFQGYLRADCTRLKRLWTTLENQVCTRPKELTKAPKAESCTAQGTSVRKNALTSHYFNNDLRSRKNRV